MLNINTMSGRRIRFIVYVSSYMFRRILYVSCILHFGPSSLRPGPVWKMTMPTSAAIRGGDTYAGADEQRQRVAYPGHAPYHLLQNSQSAKPIFT